MEWGGSLMCQENIVYLLSYSEQGIMMVIRKGSTSRVHSHAKINK